MNIPLGSPSDSTKFSRVAHIVLVSSLIKHRRIFTFAISQCTFLFVTFVTICITTQFTHPQVTALISKVEISHIQRLRIRRHSRETHRKWRLSLCVYKRLLATYNGRLHVDMGPTHQEAFRPAFYRTCRPAFYRSR